MWDKQSFGGILPIFRGPFLERVAHGQHRSTLYELGDYFSSFSPPLVSAPLKDWFDFFYSLLFEQYRCEYVYKNIVAKSLYLSGRHSRKKSLLTSELRSGGSRADVVILNGTSTVYEVKSEYDTLRRLEGQIADYRTVYDRIFVVTTPEKAKSIINEVTSLVGVMVLGGKGKLRTVREAQSNKTNTNPAAIFDCMRREEYCSIIRDIYGSVPNVPNSKLYRESKRLFCRLDPCDAHDLMVQRVRMRGKRKPFADLINDAPDSLKHACLSFSKSQALALRIREKLTEPLMT